MQSIPDYSDERNHAWCVHCGKGLAVGDTSRDHVPSKALLVEPYPDNLPVIPVCTSCNNAFSADEEYVIALLGAVLAGTTEPLKQVLPRAARVFERNERLRARIAGSQSPPLDMFAQEGPRWFVEWPRVRRVILKNARGHALYELGLPMLDTPRHVHAAPLQLLDDAAREDFETLGDSGYWPEVGSRMLQRAVSGHDLMDGWIVVQPGVYRYAVDQIGEMRVRSVWFEYLGTEVLWEDD